MVLAAGAAVAGRCVGGRRSLRRWIRSLGATWILTWIGFAWGADAPALQEHQVKALYLFNFTKYVEWPAGTWAGTNAFVIGVIGAPEVEASLVEATQGKEVAGNAVVIRRFEVGADLRGCRMLYLGITDRAQTERILGALGTQPVLTVGEGEAFLDRGGMVGFVRKDKKVRLFVGLETARKAGLHVSAKLLAVAEQVRDGKAR